MTQAIYILLDCIKAQQTVIYFYNLVIIVYVIVLTPFCALTTYLINIKNYLAAF